MMQTNVVGAANSINDASSSRTVNLIIGALVALGLLMLLVTIWLWRASRPVPPHLEGLDLITKRRWLRSDESRRDDLLGHIRHARGAAPPIAMAREPEAIEPGPAMPISLDAASTSLGVASSPGVPIVSAAAPVLTEPVAAALPPGWGDDAPAPVHSAAPLGWPAEPPRIVDGIVPAGWLDETPRPADGVPTGWLDAPAVQPVVPPMFERMISASAIPPPPPAGPSSGDTGYGETNG
jgi:hypothetical protein